MMGRRTGKAKEESAEVEFAGEKRGWE